MFELVQLLGHVVPGSVCEEHIDDLSQFVTSSSRVQLSHDAAQIGKDVRVGTARLGLTVSCKSALLANDNTLGKLIVGHLEAESKTTVEKRTCASNLWKRSWTGRRRAKRVNRPCKMNPDAQKLAMLGIHPVKFTVAPHRSFHRKGQRDVQNFENGYDDGQNPSLRRHGFSVKSGVPQIATSVEQVGEWITMCRGFNVDTRRRIRKVWRKIAPILANDPSAGAKRQVQSLPLSARVWKRTGSRVRQVSSRLWTPELPSTALCSMWCRLSTISPEMWRCNHGRKRLGTQRRHGDRYQNFLRHVFCVFKTHDVTSFRHRS